MTSEENLDLRMEIRETTARIRADLRDLRTVMIRWYVVEMTLMVALIAWILVRG